MSSRKISNSHPNSLKKQHEQHQNISCSVAHAIPGRIRFRIPRLAKDTEYANKVKQVIELYVEGAKVRVNPTASSIVINYQNGSISDEQMRSRLIKLIQTAPNINLPKQVIVKSALEKIFNGLINLINSVRNLNQARNIIKYQRVRVNTWERLLSTGESMIKGFKSVIMFIFPHKELPSALEST
ncbi:HMA2 domain-containing protein [Anabaena subtropica]|uniref:Uncharacterized protein n=1 Tax=Anabaena subtropica FACHB-260 TaxID=2692884 RepID=A0ABR8CRX3_9NOST|nr:hypothetical protein [Anabaena subtropica]MBD2345298.1 hypothetical protein [Anabaena subtropica FACHB-260]